MNKIFLAFKTFVIDIWRKYSPSSRDIVFIPCAVISFVGTPQTNLPSLIEVCHSGYHVLFDPSTKGPRVSSEHLLGSNLLVGAEDRNCEFKVDPALPKGISATTKDYLHCGYAKGHMSPYHDFAGNQSEASDSCLYSNAVPQIQNCNNSGIWSEIEGYVESIAKRDGEVYISTGPIFNGPVITIGNGVRVPDYLFKVIYNPKLNQTLSFMVPNKSLCDTIPESYIVDQSVVEQASGLKFFPNINGYSYSKQLW